MDSQWGLYQISIILCEKMVDTTASLQVSCMSEVGQQIQQEAGLIPQKDSSKYTSIKQFINTTLRRSLMGKNDVGANINDGLDPEDQKKLEVSQGGANSKNSKSSRTRSSKNCTWSLFYFQQIQFSKTIYAENQIQMVVHILPLVIW